MSECMQKLKFFDTVSKTAVISLVSLTLTWNQYPNVQLELFLHHTKFHPDQFKRVQEKETNTICFELTLWPPATVKVI